MLWLATQASGSVAHSRVNSGLPAGPRESGVPGVGSTRLDVNTRPGHGRHRTPRGHTSRYCGAWNEPVGTAEGCRGGARYVVAQLNTPQLLGGRPLYVSNWAYLGGSTAAAQLPALEAIE